MMSLTQSTRLMDNSRSCLKTFLDVQDEYLERLLISIIRNGEINPFQTRTISSIATAKTIENAAIQGAHWIIV